jgi:transposase
MAYFVGLDVAKRTTSVCVMDKDGTVVSEEVVPTEVTAIVGALRGAGRRYRRVGMEAGSLAPTLYAGLAKARLPVICIETWHAHAMMKASRPNKTDRNDAKGIAEMMRIGVYKSVHIKSERSRSQQSLLTIHKLLKNKAGDIRNAIAQLLLANGVKLRPGKGGPTFTKKATALASVDPALSQMVDVLVAAEAYLATKVAALEKQMQETAKADPVCRRLMTAPGVGYRTALLFRAAVDEPGRFARSQTVAAHFGLTPGAHETGETIKPRRITKRGDPAVRRSLFLGAWSLMRPKVKPSWLKTWGEAIAARRGMKRAIVAMARRLAVILHRMWVTETDFRAVATVA